MADHRRPRLRGVEKEENSRAVPPLGRGGGPVAGCPPFPGLWEVPIELWGWFVRYARDQRGLSQLGLARAATVAQQTVSKIEAGGICPQGRVKVRLARALDVPTGDLFPWPTRSEGTLRGVAALEVPDA